MSKKSLYLLGIALTLLFGALLYQKFCCNSCVNPTESGTNNTATLADDNVNNGFSITGQNFDYRCIDNIKFLKNQPNAVMPFSDSVSIGVQKLKAELLANPSKKIKITGYATSDEKNTSKFENLALARANNLKTFFVSNGFKNNQFELDGIVKDKWAMTADTLVGPASFEILSSTTTSNSNENWDALKQKINSEGLILYFDTNKSRDEWSSNEQEKISNIVRYTQNVPDAIINIVGHTDNVGDRDANSALGRTRAVFAKKYLIKKGIDADKIVTDSKGPDAPIADNATETGRAQNRRTEISIK